ncbi:MAG: LD-carboxypeptidase [Thermomicrobia bacterium]|nr:LD-carboxypeptidase [Thermomicrobia bacterium]
MKIVKPPRIRTGDTIGVIAPSLPVLPEWHDRYERGKSILRGMGFAIKEGRTMGLRHGWAAGTPHDQAADINAMFGDREVGAIIAHAGGFSAISVLGHLDYAAIRAHPKPFLGMSDITLYHLALFARCGLVGFHTDTLTEGLGAEWGDLDETRRAYLTQLYQQSLTSTVPIGPIEPGRAWECWRAGQARGPLIGGCLKRITALAATPYFPALAAFDGAILFWEEIGREIWDLSIDLSILKHLGIFDRIAGMLIGELTWINRSFAGITYPPLREVVFDVIGEYRFPVMANLDFGHHLANIPLPIGTEASFDAGSRAFALLEAPVQ